jgi:hypothetical protein
MTVAFFVAIVAINGTLTLVVALLTDRGMPPARAVLALSLSGIALTRGRILSGFRGEPSSCDSGRRGGRT